MLVFEDKDRCEAPHCAPTKWSRKRATRWRLGAASTSRATTTPDVIDRIRARFAPARCAGPVSLETKRPQSPRAVRTVSADDDPLRTMKGTVERGSLRREGGTSPGKARQELATSRSCRSLAQTGRNEARHRERPLGQPRRSRRNAAATRCRALHQLDRCRPPLRTAASDFLFFFTVRLLSHRL